MTNLPAVASEDREIPSEYVGKIEANYYCRVWNAKRLKYCRRRAGAGTTHSGVGRCRHHEGRPIRHGRYSSIQRPALADLIAQHEADLNPLDLLPDLAAARALFQDFVERYDEWRDALLGWYESWNERQRPIAATLTHSVGNVLDDYEGLLEEQGRDLEDLEAEDLKAARKFVEYLSDPTAVARPRKMLDVSDAIRHLDVITKIVARIEQIGAQNAISRRDFVRLMNAMGVAVERSNDIEDPAERLKAIRSEWMSLRAN